MTYMHIGAVELNGNAINNRLEIFLPSLNWKINNLKLVHLGHVVC